MARRQPLRNDNDKMKAFLQYKHKESDKKVLQALIPFVELKDCVLFTCKANPNQHIQKESKELAKSNAAYYQRRIDDKRLRSMQDYIISSILDERDGKSVATLFPTSLILAMTTEQQIEAVDGLCDLNLEGNMFIVDGQHRMIAMIKLYEALANPRVEKTDNVRCVLGYLESYRFNCTILINYDLWEQSQVFINVNFKQKPVNKSLYYEVFGSEYNDRTNDPKQNIIYHAHMLTARLNTYALSPFCKHVKMLGTGNGYVSQAFFVESLMQLFKPGKAWCVEYGKDMNLQAHTAELLTFFHTVRELLEAYWPKAGDAQGTLICKTTGVGAFVRLMGYIHEKHVKGVKSITGQLSATPEEEICKPYHELLKKILSPLCPKANELFGVSSRFLNTSGKATESILFKTMREVIDGNNDIPSVKPEDRHPFDMDLIAEQLQEYLWTKPQDDLDCLGHHYELESIDNIHEDSCTVLPNGNFDLCLSFRSYVTVYLDNEDDSGMTYSFPATVSGLCIQNQDDKWTADFNDIDIKFNTDEYYQ